VSNIEGIGEYIKELDVLAPSFALAMIMGYIVSKIYPTKNDNKVLSETAE
jgi:Na+/glutamate symporter